MLKSILGGAGLLGLVLMAAPAVAGSSGLAVIDQIKVGGTGGWDYANFDTATRRLFLAHGTTLAAIDVDSRTVTAHFADTAGSHIALPLGDGSTIVVTQGKASKVAFLNAKTGADLGDLPTGEDPDGAIFDPASGKVLVLDNDGHQIDVIDPIARKIDGHIALNGAPESGQADGAGLVFTHLEDMDAIVVIDSHAMTVKATYALDDCKEPSGLVFIPHGRLLMSACRNGIARISSADTGAEVATVPIGQRADGALYDEARHLGYVPGGDGTLTVISFEGAPHVIDTIITKAGARTAALDPKTGRVYLPTADFGPAPADGKRPPIIPDSFEVLVVGKP